jgi:hypothetical protein
MVMCLARSHTQGAIFDAPEFANSIVYYRNPRVNGLAPRVRHQAMVAQLFPWPSWPRTAARSWCSGQAVYHTFNEACGAVRSTYA